MHFLPGSFTDNAGSSNMAKDEQFLVSSTGASPGPIAVLASPANGTAVTVGTINGQRYVDITYRSLDGTGIVKSDLENALVAPFKVEGTGVTTDLSRDGTNHAILLGAPELKNGRADD